MCVCVSLSFFSLFSHKTLSATTPRRLLHRNDIFDAIVLVFFIYRLLLLLGVFHVLVGRFSFIRNGGRFFTLLVFENLCKVFLRF